MTAPPSATARPEMAQPEMAQPEMAQPETAGFETEFAAALLDPSRTAPGVEADACRFSVYRNNVVAGLIDALAATYPAVLALVGEAFFRAAAGEFVRAHPPGSPVLIDYGGALPGWIAGFPPAARVPYLGDVARLEWAWSRAYNAADAAPLGAEALAGVPPDRLAEARLILHPSATVVVSRHPAVSLWGQATGREDRSRLDLRTAETALVSRPREAVEVRRIDTATASFLSGLGHGMPLGRAVEHAAGCAGFDLAAEIAGVFAKGLVVGVEHACSRASRPGERA